MSREDLGQIDSLEIEALSDDELDSVAGGAPPAVTDTSSCSCSCCVAGATTNPQPPIILPGDPGGVG